VASQARDGQGKRRSKKLRYLYLNGDLHRVLHINRPADIITMWSYSQHKRVGYTYSDVKARMEKAFTTTEVCKMLNRTKVTVENAILNGDIEAPQYTYGLTETKKKYQYLWHEKDIMALHEVLSNRHVGKPRKDGLINPRSLPTAREVKAMIRHDAILYVKTDDGRFVPTWEAEQF
jgi:hypothetical protein